MTAPAGWYTDAQGSTRWWDGSRWGEEAPVVATSPEYLPVPQGTTANTTWVWLIVLLPVLSTIAAIGYLVQMQQGMFEVLAVVPLDGSSSLDVDKFIAAEFNAFLRPWYLVLTLSGWAVYGLSVWFAALDARELAARGFVRPFPWAWTFLSSLVYVIGRHVVIRRRAEGFWHRSWSRSRSRSPFSSPHPSGRPCSPCRCSRRCSGWSRRVDCDAAPPRERFPRLERCDRSPKPKSGHRSSMRTMTSCV